LATYNFLDPACGCGNFLIVAYREMRRLELAILKQLRDLKEDSQLSLDPTLGLHVSVTQFSGIEIEEWPAKVAETAMFLVDHQMNLELAEEFGQTPDRLPIKQMLNVRVGNALTTDWRDVCPIGDNTLILGNPPFMGRLTRNAEQAAELKAAFQEATGSGNVDYVCAWFARASDYLRDCLGRAAFIATNSITQGEQPFVLWTYMQPRGMEISFAHRTFAWSSDAPKAAAVHVVVVGFTRRPGSTHTIWHYPDVKGAPSPVIAKRINPYLQDAPTVLLARRKEPLDPSAPAMKFGSMANDGGWLSDLADEDVQSIQREDKIAAKYLRKLLDADALLEGRYRWCLWLKEAPPADLTGSPSIRKRLDQVRVLREKSTRAATNALAKTPYLFGEDRQPTARYIAIPRVSSERRTYVPIGIVEASVVANDRVLTIAPFDLYTFGILMSRIFNAWNATVSGRMKSDFSISSEVTYYNFPWPVREATQRVAIEAAAQGVIDARAKHPDQALAALYDPLGMPPDLLKAHEQLDRVALAAYGLKPSATDAEILSGLFTRYEELVAPMAGMMGKKKRP
jgi:hypothetical protein